MTACSRCGFDPEAVVAATWSFLVDRDPPSLNTRLFNAGAARWRYSKERDAWVWEFRNQRLLAKIPKATGLRRVTFTRVYGGRQQERDVDNLTGGGKVVVDALVLEQLIQDDSPRSAEIHWKQERGGPVGLHVLLEEIA